MGLFYNFFAVYLSAPVIQSAVIKEKGLKEEEKKISKFETFSKLCPINCFQKNAVDCLQEFTVSQRLFSIIKVAPKLFIIGFIAMTLGGIFTKILSLMRHIINNGHDVTLLDFSVLFNGSSSRKIIIGSFDLIKNSVAIGLYLAVSSSIRYQLVSGVFESRIIDPLFAKVPIAQTIISFILRTLNTYLGSALMVDYLKLIDAN